MLSMSLRSHRSINRTCTARATSLVTVLVAASIPPLVPAASAQERLWVRQFGESGLDVVLATTADGSDGVVVTGVTFSSLGGPHAGGYDIFLARYDHAGNQSWIRQFGTSEQDHGRGIASDGHQGVFVVGATNGSLGGPNAGENDVILARYDNEGNQLWIRQFGTSKGDYTMAAASDGAGGVILTGITYGVMAGSSAGRGDVFLARYDSNGNQLWIAQFGTPYSDWTYAITPDGAGGAFVAGDDESYYGGSNPKKSDAFLAHYDQDGNQLWVRRFGTDQDDYAFALSPDGLGGVFVAGATDGSLGGPNAGWRDIFLARYDSDGEQLWIKQFGGTTGEEPTALTPDGNGGVVMTGRIDTRPGWISWFEGGEWDVFLNRYDSEGNEIWSSQFGTDRSDWATSIALDSAGDVVVAGTSEGKMTKATSQLGGAFIARHTVASCYADGDKTTGDGVLDLFDFLRFQTSFISGDLYACNCDMSTGPGLCDVIDFMCFRDSFYRGCP